MLLSLTQSLLMFYLLFCIARMNLAGPFDLGIYGALNSWFVARRAFATLDRQPGADGGSGRAAAHRPPRHASDGGWRAGWLAVGATVLLVGFVPTWLFMVRRPEDVGLVPDRRSPAAAAKPASTRRAPMPSRLHRAAGDAHAGLLAALALHDAVYPVQAGVSLHQAPHLIERGLSPAIAATIVSIFSLDVGGGRASASASSRGGSASGSSLALAAMLRSGSAPLLMLGVATPLQGYLAAGCFGVGHRRHAHRAAAGLGGLLRPRELRRHPRRGA